MNDELSGAELDLAVAKAEGLAPIPNQPPGYFYWHDAASGDRSGFYDPSTNWELGGPIIERERITVSSPREFCPRWSAVCFLRPSGIMVRSEGRTPLIAAMRAYAASKGATSPPSSR